MMALGVSGASVDVGTGASAHAERASAASASAAMLRVVMSRWEKANNGYVATGPEGGGGWMPASAPMLSCTRPEGDRQYICLSEREDRRGTATEVPGTSLAGNRYRLDAPG